MNELKNYEYKDIPGYEGLYAVTTCGKVWSYLGQKFLKPWTANGYLLVALTRNFKKKNCRVHRLVLETFNPVPGSDVLDANHLNEDRADNRLENLEWATRKENNNWGTRNQRISEYRKEPVRCIETGYIYESQLEAAEAVGLSSSSGISQCCTGKYKTSGGYHWEFCPKSFENEGILS